METYKILQAMKATGNRPGVVAQWKATVEAWAQNVKDPNAEAVKAWLPAWQVRPFYTADELAPIWPAISLAIGYRLTWPSVLKSPKRLEHEMDFYGWPHVMVNDRKYYCVEQLHIWGKARTQEEIERAINA
jgi:hypothetical protein